MNKLQNNTENKIGIIVELQRKFKEENKEVIDLIQTSTSVDELDAIRHGFKILLEQSKRDYPNVPRMDIATYTSTITRRIIELTTPQHA